ncbi:jg15841 [Pararge aegeria aegeria]|uniref:Jg15841 protein n=1 Tax=Pararge aegeria aegeria TaxID=348720 RepID=A0A8S4SLS9_9NEOP|nr:jg15841 [Pararge aegeria aegeria]
MGDRRTILQRWVKGHDGNPGNEAADSLARQATTLKVVGPEPIVPIPFSVTDSPLCRACMEKNETPTHVMLECTGVTEQREIYLGSPATIPEILSNLGGMLGFWNELGWLE